MRKFLSILIISAFVLAGISPACKFISGAHALTEICGADGSIKQMPVPEELAAFLPGQQDNNTQKHDHQSAGDDCAFCFAQTHISKISAAPVEVPTATPAATNDFLFLITHHASLTFPYQSRAPPAFLS